MQVLCKLGRHASRSIGLVSQPPFWQRWLRRCWAQLMCNFCRACLGMPHSLLEVCYCLEAALQTVLLLLQSGTESATEMAITFLQ